ncbi:MAG: glycerol-3-phosphate dehydrogenase [Bacteroidetes bacterium SW_9_63_38]|nr:MAG: glycerol-3-phosphate dehydrogenase [Bacteroidetes bacterium SW_9_63_38]
MSSIAFFGAGRWGTALSVHLASAGRDVTLWTRRSGWATPKAPRSAPSLPELLHPSSVEVTTDLVRAATSADVWGIAVPIPAVRACAEALRPHVHDDVTAVALSKGIEADTMLTTSQVLGGTLDALSPDRIGVLCGPSHAEDVAEGRPTTVVAAAHSEDAARRIQRRFMTERLRVYLNADLRGVELGGTARFVLAIAAGIIDGGGYGENAKAALVTRGLAEVRRLGRALGADARTFSGLAGIGDLVVTCMSARSPARQVGEQVARGRPTDQILDDADTIGEGVQTTRSLYNLAQKHNVEMPITEAVYSVLFDDKQPSQMVKRLMTRSPKREDWAPPSTKHVPPDWDY